MEKTFNEPRQRQRHMHRPRRTAECAINHRLMLCLTSASVRPSVRESSNFHARSIWSLFFSLSLRLAIFVCVCVWLFLLLLFFIRNWSYNKPIKRVDNWWEKRRRRRRRIRDNNKTASFLLCHWGKPPNRSRLFIIFLFFFKKGERKNNSKNEKKKSMSQSF